MEDKKVIIMEVFPPEKGRPFEFGVMMDGESKRISSWEKQEMEVGKTYNVTLLDEDPKDVQYNQRRMKKGSKTEFVTTEKQGTLDTLEVEEPIVEAIIEPTKPDETKVEPPKEVKTEQLPDDFDDAFSGMIEDMDNDKNSEINNKDNEQLAISDNNQITVTQGNMMTLETQKQIFASKWALFNFVKDTVLKPDDWFRGQYLKKSGFRKFAQAFRLQLKIIDKSLQQFDPPLIIRAPQNYKDGTKKGDKIELDWQYSVIVRVYMPDIGFGEAYAEQIGVVGSWDNNAYQSPHNALGKAITRAYSRAIADLVGYGVYSAEDIQ